MFKIPSLHDVSEKVNTDEKLKRFSIKDIEKGNALGGTSFGTTFIAKFIGKEVSLKQLHARNYEVLKFLKEAKIMSSLVHGNIFGFEAVFYKLLIFMKELVVFDINVFYTDPKLKTLEDLLRCCDSSMFQKIEKTLPSATDTVEGLKYFHSKEVLHLDLKPAMF